jgi:hypothetical protein
LTCRNPYPTASPWGKIFLPLAQSLIYQLFSKNANGSIALIAYISSEKKFFPRLAYVAAGKIRPFERGQKE